MELKSPTNMNFDATSNLAETWRRWEQQFRVYFTAAEVNKKPKATQVAILLHTCGPQALDIYGTFTFADTEDKDSVDVILTKFKNYCEPRKNIVYEKFKFWSRNQEENESADQWTTELKRRAASCEFGTQTDAMVRDKIVFGVHNGKVKERLLREPDLDLKKALDICRAAEMSIQQMQEMASTDETVHMVDYRKNRGPQREPATDPSVPTRRQQSSQPANCEYCGGRHGPRQCPAWGKTCNKCSKKNHYSNVCKSSNLRSVKTLQSEEASMNEQFAEPSQSFFVGAITQKASSSKDKWQADLKICNTNVTFRLDTGAQVNVLPLFIF